MHSRSGIPTSDEADLVGYGCGSVPDFDRLPPSERDLLSPGRAEREQPSKGPKDPHCPDESLIAVVEDPRREPVRAVGLEPDA